MTSIIVPCWNQREFTQHCVRALVRHTAPDWDLIVVDNGSTDGTAEYLAGLQDGGRVPVTIVRNERNLGYPAAINQGLQVARGEHLVLLNNDTVVTEGWLDQLIALTAAPVETTNEAAHRYEQESLNASCTKNTDGQKVLKGAGGSETDSLPTPRSRRLTRGIGLVGPMSNYATPPQLVENVPYQRP